MGTGSQRRIPGKEVRQAERWPLGRRQVEKEVREMSLGSLSLLSAIASSSKPSRMHNRPMDDKLQQPPRGEGTAPPREYRRLLKKTQNSSTSVDYGHKHLTAIVHKGPW